MLQTTILIIISSMYFITACGSNNPVSAVYFFATFILVNIEVIQSANQPNAKL